MDPAFASLLGAVIGGAIASGSNLGVEWFRGRRQNAAEQKQTEIELRRSARLLVAELRYSADLILKAEDRDYFTWEPPERELPNSAWSDHRGPLAEHGSSEDWDAVARAYDEIDRLNWLARDAAVEEGWVAGEMRTPLEGPSLVPAAELHQSRRMVAVAIQRLEDLPKT
jgi:hypothetical protein